MKKIIEIYGIEIEIERKNIKNMYLKVCPPFGQVKISAPYNLREEEINIFISGKKDWIYKQRAKYSNSSERDLNQYRTGEIHYLWGQAYSLEATNSADKNWVGIRENKLVLRTKPETTLEEKERILNKWYRMELEARLPGLVKHWEEIIGVKANEIRIKNMRTRWGSCNTRVKRIWINLKLAQKPIACLEYIVVHELVHLIERKHNNVFKSYLDRFLPNWRQIKEQLLGN